MLAHDQGDLCAAFAGKDTDRLAGRDWTPAPSGAPILNGVLAWIDCEAQAVLDAGDHEFVTGRVTGLAAVDGRPLVFWRGGYAIVSA